MKITGDKVIGPKHETSKETFSMNAVLDGPFQMGNGKESKMVMRVTNFATDQKTVVSWCFIDVDVFIKSAQSLKELIALQPGAKRRGFEVKSA